MCDTSCVCVCINHIRVDTLVKQGSVIKNYPTKKKMNEQLLRRIFLEDAIHLLQN